MAGLATPEYSLSRAFARIEGELVESIIRNLKAHVAEETELGFAWEAWQTIQLRELERYARANAIEKGREFDKLNARIEEAIKKAYSTGQSETEAAALEAVRRGAKMTVPDGGIHFFGVQDAKLNALVAATHGDLMKAEFAVLRRANDVYRQTIFDAQVYAASGAGTYEKAVDMATRDFLSKGIDGIIYSNGSRHTIPDYASMVIRTSAKRARFAGEADTRDRWGVHTVIVPYRDDACADCMEFVGEVLIDDVYGGGTAAEAKEGDYTLLSEAMDAGLFHPNCKDGLTTYFEGVTEKPSRPTRSEQRAAEEREQQDQRENAIRDNAERYQRLADNQLDAQDAEHYQALADEWASKEI